MTALQRGIALLALCLLFVGLSQASGNKRSNGGPSYTRQQADRGASLYGRYCGACHGPNLSDGAHAPPIKGDNFRVKWSDKPAAQLLEYLSTQMPPRMSSVMGMQQHADVMAFLLQENGIPPDNAELPDDPAELEGARLPPWPTYASGGGLAPGTALPPPPPRADPLAALTPIDETMLQQPAAADWLSWRGAHAAYGYSELEQVDTSNVAGLQLAWSWTLPAGPNGSTPLVHDGVMFVHGFGDHVQALDAATGELLWQYAHRLPSAVAASHKRSIALYQNMVLVPTSDAHVVALDMRSGEPVWETAIGDPAAGVQLISGPLVARGKVMIGTSGRLPGGNYIVGLDAASGVEAWRFHVIQRPDEGGQDSWNGIPLEARNGGSLWMPASFDSRTGLAYFAPANSYDTLPLRVQSDRPDVNNDGLYLNSTLALDPDNGRLAWHYQHQANDQWDLDWAFERQSLSLEIDGRRENVVLTAGKSMIFDLLRAEDGGYLRSYDLGLQNVVTAIDPRTGRKQIDPTLVPGDGQTKVVCPHVSGGRSWLPTAYDPERRRLIVPITEACMDLIPAGPGEQTILSTQVRWTVRPRPESDGLYGRLQALDPTDGGTQWTVRERAPFTAGTLATAGGLVFAGSLDRYLKGYDIDTGKRLWAARLNDAPSAPPITYAVNGKQYLAVIVGPGGYHSMSYNSLVPEVRNPAATGTVLWVFALPNTPMRSGRMRRS